MDEDSFDDGDFSWSEIPDDLTQSALSALDKLSSSTSSHLAATTAVTSSGPSAAPLSPSTAPVVAVAARNKHRGRPFAECAGKSSFRFCFDMAHRDMLGLKADSLARRLHGGHAGASGIQASKIAPHMVRLPLSLPSSPRRLRGPSGPADVSDSPGLAARRPPGQQALRRHHLVAHPGPPSYAPRRRRRPRGGRFADKEGAPGVISSSSSAAFSSTATSFLSVDTPPRRRPPFRIIYRWTLGTPLYPPPSPVAGPHIDLAPSVSRRPRTDPLIRAM